MAPETPETAIRSHDTDQIMGQFEKSIQVSRRKPVSVKLIGFGHVR